MSRKIAMFTLASVSEHPQSSSFYLLWIVWFHLSGECCYFSE